ncbi:MAG: DUF4276 family protein [Gallionella sp.]
MLEVIIFVEGKTEEKFIKEMIAPLFYPQQVFLKPKQLKTSQESEGGALTFDRLKFNARNKLRENPKAILTTFMDLYKLDTDFPNFEQSKGKPDVYSRVEYLENALHQAIVQYVDCSPERFIPYIQPYEFEGLLFSDVNALVSVVSGGQAAFKKLQKIRDDFPSPEHINDSYETKPSERLKNVFKAEYPKYKKTTHGPLAARKITLPVIEQHCLHFHQWMDKLRALAATQP